MSPVKQLSEAIKQMKESTTNLFPSIDIYGVLLSESTIHNAMEMRHQWESMNIHVIDCLTGLRHREIAINKDYNQKAREIIDCVVTKGYRQDAPKYPWKKEIDYKKGDEIFEKYLLRFLNDDFEVVDEEHHVIEDIAIPDGNIEQNQNTTVTVEILRPMSNPHKELNKLVGCTEIKKRMRELIALTKYNKLMKELYPNSKQHEVYLLDELK